MLDLFVGFAAAALEVAAGVVGPKGDSVGCEDFSVVGGWQAAQAVELVRALVDQLHLMTTQLARVECQDVTGRKGRAVRMEAAELRRDIKEAQDHIDQLQRRYLSGGERTRQHPAGGQRRAMLDRQAK
jgi:hypothetical protein